MTDEVVKIPRTDPAYNMHGYLTKVPVGAIIPFITEYSPKEGVVLDMFAGSGMTAVASRMCGRNAIVSDISILGRHIGQGYLTCVEPENLNSTANEIVTASRNKVGGLYRTIRATDQKELELIRTIWSFIYRCNGCGTEINYYETFKAASWKSSEMVCLKCMHPFEKKFASMVGEEPVFTAIHGEKKQAEQPLNRMDFENISKAEHSDILNKIPSNKIGIDREMYHRSALGKWGLTETKLFFSHRNATILFDLWERINEVKDQALRKKLLFCFTAILPRASKRYQWSRKAPLNAANQNYYIAPVFYEWNVYDLFLRKITACIRSDDFIGKNNTLNITQEYLTASAHNLEHVRDNSIDYVFTDPPFGSNIFYADMNLFQEAWLGDTTNNLVEAVMRTTGGKETKSTSAESYKDLLTGAFKEAYRVLKPEGVCSIVFGNSKGKIWSIAQQAIRNAGFTGKPLKVSILDKGQRSVKGLNSGHEKISTLDLIVTVKKEVNTDHSDLIIGDSKKIIHKTLDNLKLNEKTTASHVYAEVLRSAIANNICMADIDLHDIMVDLNSRGIFIRKETGYLYFKEAIDPVIA